jgi:hypothetical protein
MKLSRFDGGRRGRPRWCWWVVARRGTPWTLRRCSAATTSPERRRRRRRIHRRWRMPWETRQLVDVVWLVLK